MGPDGQWRFLIGSSKNSRGIAYLYKSKDFINWVQDENPFHSKEKTGNWEGLDFFPISLKGNEGLENWMINGENVKFVLKVSLDPTRYDYYTIGKYLPKTDRYILDNTALDGSKGLRYDYGNFYASKSLFDPGKKRRIIWGFSNESDTRMDIVEKGWNGTLPIPRRIWLDPNGKQLLVWPIEEVESLRGHEVQLRNKKIKKGEVLEIEGITAAQADVEAVFFFPSLSKAERFDPSWDHIDAQELCSRKGSAVQGGLGPFGLLTLASEKLEEHTPVFFRIFEDKNKHRILLCSDASSSSLKKGIYKPSFAGFVDVDLSKKMLSLRSLIDHSIVESFAAGGKVCITSRVYPTLAVFNNAHLYAFNNGSQTVTIKKLEAWSMNKPKEMN
ncbi:unnamed protein product [Coffea canephora]|uniref:Uncharacterized protein n=1 Tax=Coffea canephora TaxID=49390 RepID=A0A068V883_COFCA|nr:unnamed protein product [Coffea canephora]